jgi:hypothetical protein
MLNESTYLQLDLKAGEAISLTGTHGSELVCVRGQIWLTEERSSRDVTLRAGRSFRLRGTGRTAIQAIGTAGDASCRVLLPQPRGLRALLSGWVRLIAGQAGDYCLVFSRKHAAPRNDAPA